MKTIRKKIIVGLMSLLIILPQISLADGMMMPRPEYWIQETGQKAVIMYEDGIETMVISTSFKGDANDFAWVIPVPNKPEVSKGSQELFSKLDSLTGYYYDDVMPHLGLGMAQDVAKEGVTIVEQKQIDYYDVTVLSSTDKDSLVNWLNENNYNFPTSASYVLNSYIDNNWYFVAMRVNPESLEWSDVSESLREGQATPVILQFEAKNIVYPMKVSSIVSQEINQDEPTYSSGIVGKSVSIGNDDIVTFDGTDSFNTSSGTVEVWVKPDGTWESSGGYWEFLNVVDSNGNDIFEFRRGKDYKKDGLQFIAYNNSNIFQAWSMVDSITWENKWYHLAVTWSENQQPIFYINGVAYNSESNYNTKTWEMKSPNTKELILGQRGKYGSSVLHGFLDEVRISDNIRTPEQIQLSYNTVNNGQELIADPSAILLSHFNSSLKEEVSGKDLSYETVDTYDLYYENYVPITLYVLAANKKTLPDFTTNFANWIDKESIEKLALDDQGDPLLKPLNKKYFLTKLYGSMTVDQMTEDLFIRDASDNLTSGQEIKSTGAKSINTFYIAVGVAIALSLIFSVTIFVISRKVD